MEYRIKAPAVKSCTETVSWYSGLYDRYCWSLAVSYVDLVGLYNFSLQVNVNIIQCNVVVLNIYICIHWQTSSAMTDHGQFWAHMLCILDL